ncbi:MAG: response regulator [Rhodospirillales bacterium]
MRDDPHYARVMLDLARDTGFKVLVAMRGSDALALAREYLPTAISLDVFLPDMLGWTVLSQLKQDPLTRHIPVQIVTLDEDRQHGLARGAFSFLSKPTTTEGLEGALAGSRIMPSHGASACCWWRTIPPSRSGSASCYTTAISTSPPCRPVNRHCRRCEMIPPIASCLI